MQIWPGQPYPLGATFDGVGTNFSVFSEVAERVELSFVRRPGQGDANRSAGNDGALLARLRAGRASGSALRLSRARSLGSGPGPLVQSEQAAARSIRQGESTACGPGTRRCFRTVRAPETSRNDLDSAPFVPKGIVVNPFFDWGNDRRPNTPWHRTVVYETHVKGFTKRHPEIPEEIRGTYAGMAHPAAVKYLQRLGITAVELLPVHQFVQDSTLLDRKA